MKWMGLVLLLPIAVWANDWSKHSISELVDTYLVAKASTTYVLDPKQVKERPYTIQVAAHINEREAVQHVEQLKIQEDKVFYYPNFVKSQVFFKVCVGRFHTKEEAESYRKEFMRRMDEPFAVTIALGDAPGVDKTATKAQVASAKNSSNKTMKRTIASVDKNHTIDLKSEAKGTDAKMNVQLMHKKTAAATPVAAAAHEATAASKMYALQVASFPSEEVAKAESEKLRVKGQETFYRPAEVKGKTWYRVFIGKFTKFSEAQAFQAVYGEQRPGQTIIRKFLN